MFEAVFAFIIAIFIFIFSLFNSEENGEVSVEKNGGNFTSTQPTSTQPIHTQPTSTQPTSTQSTSTQPTTKKEIVTKFLRENDSEYVVVVGGIISPRDDRKYVFVDTGKTDDDIGKIDGDNFPVYFSDMTLDLADKLDQRKFVLIVLYHGTCDSKILINLARTYAIIEESRPIASLVRFQLPKYNMKILEFKEQIGRNSYKSDFDYVRELGIDFVINYKKGIVAFYGGEIMSTGRNKYLLARGHKIYQK
jgi:uncharacterized protein YdeI (BOF family)